MSATITLIEAVQIGSHRSMAHVNYGYGKGGAWKEVDVPEYDMTFARPFASAMFRDNIGLRDGATKAGLTVVQLSGLRMGSLTCSPEDWRKVWLAVLGREPETIDRLCSPCKGKGLVWPPGFRDGGKTCVDCGGTGLVQEAADA